MKLVIASHFLAGSILTLVLPVGVVAAIGISWAIVLRRRGFDEEA